MDKCRTNALSGGSLHEAADETERLQAIVDKLPKTADGVPVTPEMILWRKWPDLAPECDSIRTATVKAVHASGATLYCVAHGDGYRETPVPWSELYSTREAAKAAIGAEKDSS